MQCELVGVVLQTCLGVHCIEYDVRMYMVSIGVSCHHNFVSREGFLRKLNCDLVSKRRPYLIAAGV